MVYLRMAYPRITFTQKRLALEKVYLGIMVHPRMVCPRMSCPKSGFSRKDMPKSPNMVYPRMVCHVYLPNPKRSNIAAILRHPWWMQTMVCGMLCTSDLAMQS